MKSVQEIKSAISQLLATQQLAVLATEANHHPHTSLMAFVSSEDLKKIYFATERATQKYNNISRNGNIALLVDNRTNTIDDFKKAIALTILGYAKELPEPEKKAAMDIFLNRFPHLRDFAKSSACSLFQLDVEHYVLVGEFQDVVSYKP
jgi:uncharacterized protein YhbP (UPF0306 family)